MIERYSREEIKKIWDLESKFNYYLRVELAVCEAYAKLGKIPKTNLEQIKEKASFSVERIDEIEREEDTMLLHFLPMLMKLLVKIMQNIFIWGLQALMLSIPLLHFKLRILQK